MQHPTRMCSLSSTERHSHQDKAAENLWHDDQILQANVPVPGPAVPSVELHRDNVLTFAPLQAKDYELRQYETAKWVSTVIRGESQKEAMRQGFWKLFHYIQGKNERETKIDMTVPVTCLVKSGCTDFKISFFVPFEHQDSPPQPTDSDVFVEERKAAAIFVRSFGGFASPEKYAEEAEVLARTLRNRGQPFHEDFFYTAGYDSPFKLFNRHNEVWYFKK
ncbi:heme-binding protein 2-like isoform X1 [Myiozetetes cayanensis]|nr:heme-binding protein 2-like isoform X1 [Myiozetetes cayanensis]